MHTNSKANRAIKNARRLYRQWVKTGNREDRKAYELAMREVWQKVR